VSHRGRGSTIGKEAFFFEKKNQKTFAIEVRHADTSATPMSKSFCFFFQKEALLFLPAPSGI
jgi:hypothetical protein